MITTFVSNFFNVLTILVSIFYVIYALLPPVGVPLWFSTASLCYWSFFAILDLVVHVSTFDHIVDVVEVLICLFVFLLRPPRNRRRVRKLIGAKARALRAKLIGAMPKPSPIPRPKPSPA